MYKIFEHRKDPCIIVLDVWEKRIAYLFAIIKYFSIAFFCLLLLQRNLFPLQ